MAFTKQAGRGITLGSHCIVQGKTPALPGVEEERAQETSTASPQGSVDADKVNSAFSTLISVYQALKLTTLGMINQHLWDLLIPVSHPAWWMGTEGPGFWGQPKINDRAERKEEKMDVPQEQWQGLSGAAPSLSLGLLCAHSTDCAQPIPGLHQKIPMSGTGVAAELPLDTKLVQLQGLQRVAVAVPC